MRRKSRGSPSGIYRSAQKRLIKSFREVKKKKRWRWLDGLSASLHTSDKSNEGGPDAPIQKEDKANRLLG